VAFETIGDRFRQHVQQEALRTSLLPLQKPVLLAERIKGLLALPRKVA
jgi:hypothetical protein